MAWTSHPIVKPSKRAIRRAIAIVEDSQQSHLDAIQDPDNQILGDAAFHKLCVKDYAYVLKVLRAVERTHA